MEQFLKQEEKLVDLESRPKQFNEMEIFDKNDRLVRAWGSVEMIDEDNQVIPINEIKRIMPVLMDRGGDVMDTHSNRKIGKIINYEFMDKAGKPAILLTLKVFDDYQTDDEVWEAIKRQEYRGVSFGGRFHAKVSDLNGIKPVEILKKLEGFEFSVVPMPANKGANITEVNFLAKGVKESIKQIIMKAQSHADLIKQDNPFAICTATVGRQDSEKFERCVLDVKDELGLKADKSVDLDKVLPLLVRLVPLLTGLQNENTTKGINELRSALARRGFEVSETELQELQDALFEAYPEIQMSNKMEDNRKTYKEKSLSKSMKKTSLKKQEDGEGVAPENGNGNGASLEEIKQLLMQILQMLGVANQAGHPELEDPRKRDEEEEENMHKEGEDSTPQSETSEAPDTDADGNGDDEDKEKEVDKQGEKQILPLTPEEKAHKDGPAEGAEGDEIKIVEKRIRTEVSKQMNEIKKQLKITDQNSTTPRPIAKENYIKKGELEMPKTWKEANLLAKKYRKGQIAPTY